MLCLSEQNSGFRNKSRTVYEVIWFEGNSGKFTCLIWCKVAYTKFAVAGYAPVQGNCSRGFTPRCKEICSCGLCPSARKFAVAGLRPGARKFAVAGYAPVQGNCGYWLRNSLFNDIVVNPRWIQLFNCHEWDSRQKTALTEKYSFERFLWIHNSWIKSPTSSRGYLLTKHAQIRVYLSHDIHCKNLT